MLANFLASPDNPLTARVMVNRIWQFRMGTGLVRTPNDFGVLGDRSAYHQKLLDYLATEFMDRHWSVKAIDRLIVLSSVYQQSATPDAAKSAIDPDNRFYWRMNSKRMEAETLRDNVLAVSGTLNPKLGRPPGRVPIEPEAYKLALARTPRAVELKMGKQFLASGGKLPDFCLALLNRNEFVYIP